MLTAPEESARFTTTFKRLKPELMASIGELMDELSDSANNIAVQAMEHIHSNEVIMTLGYSRTVAAFLQRAAEERGFHVIVAECAPGLQGQRMAHELGQCGIDTTLITDSAIYAIMSRVNKVRARAGKGARAQRPCSAAPGALTRFFCSAFVVPPPQGHHWDQRGHGRRRPHVCQRHACALPCRQAPLCPGEPRGTGRRGRRIPLVHSGPSRRARLTSFPQCPPF